jgi:hypothetical protein
VADGRAVVAAKVGDRLEVWRQTSRQPHQLDVALTFTLETPARRHPVQIPINVDLEHHAWVVGRAARDCGRATVETKFRKVQFVDESIDDPDRIVLSDVVIDAFGK